MSEAYGIGHLSRKQFKINKQTKKQVSVCLRKLNVPISQATEEFPALNLCSDHLLHPASLLSVSAREDPTGLQSLTHPPHPENPPQQH